MREHRLRREIIATVVANQLVDRAGTTFVFRLGEETGAPASLLARGYTVAREVFEMRSFWEQVEALDNQVAAQIQLEMLIEGRRLVERATRWLVRANPRGIEIEDTTNRFAPSATVLSDACPEVLGSEDQEAFATRAAELKGAGVPADLATRSASMPRLLAVFDLVEVASATGRPFEEVMATYFAIGSRVVLTWLRDRILELPRANRWQALSRAALRDDLNSLHRELTQQVLESAPDGAAGDTAFSAWRSGNATAVERTLGILDDIQASRTYDTTTLPVALREVRNLISGTKNGV
jgi:glutamate dehydrogenase